MHVAQIVCLILLGITAGEELAVRYGVQPAISRLEDTAHILARQALIRQLRVLVPCIMLPGFVLTVVVLLFSGSGAGYGLRWAAVVAMTLYLLSSFLGTVPINIKVNDWKATSPPPNWKAVFKRWETIDTIRSASATMAFIFLAISRMH
jgi:uncharacterized membrane protein